MKKLLSLTLALALIFCLFAACTTETTDDGTTTPGGATAEGSPSASQGNEEESGSLTEEQLLASKPNEYIQEKLDAGIPVTIAVSFTTSAEQILQMMDADLKTEFEALGFNYSSADAEVNPATQIQQIENFMEMGAAAIITVLSDPTPFDSIAQQCIAAGTYFITFASAPAYEVSGYAILDQAKFAAAFSDAVTAYLDYKYPDAGPGEVKAAFLGWGTSGDLKTFIDSLLESLAANEPRINIIFSHDNVVDIDGGFSAAQDALTVDPEIRVFIVTSGSQAVGANNYITTLPGVDLSKYAILTRGISTATLELLEKGSTNDGSVFRILGGSGYGTAVYFSTFEVTRRLLFGEAQAPYPMEDRYYIDSNFGYYFDSSQ